MTVKPLPMRYFPTKARDAVYSLLTDTNVPLEMRRRQIEVIKSDVELSLNVLNKEERLMKKP